MRKTEIWGYVLIPKTITTVPLNPPPPKKKQPSSGNYRKDIWLNTENKRGEQTRDGAGEAGRDEIKNCVLHGEESEPYV